jgi:chromosomal replication initiation ATPase DnaA
MNPSPTPIADIQALVAAHFYLPVRLMRSPDQTKPAPRARHVAMFLVHTKLGKGRKTIARFFKCDPGTVLYGIRQTRKLIDEDPAMAETVRILEQRL